jgi:hypothetical protein
MTFQGKKRLLYLFKCTFIGAILSCLKGADAMAQKENFSGSWDLDKARTIWGKFAENSAPTHLVVEQYDDTIYINREAKSQLGEAYTYLEKLPFNSNLVKSFIAGTTKKVASVELLSDHHLLKETANYVDYADRAYYKTVEIWKLSDDGKVLTIAKTDESGKGDYTLQCVYNKGK